MFVQNTTVVRLFTQQDTVSGAISLRPEGLFGPDSQTEDELRLSSTFALLNRACAIFGLATDDGRKDMSYLPSALAVNVPGAYFRWQFTEDVTGTVRGTTGGSLVHVYNGRACC